MCTKPPDFGGQVSCPSLPSSRPSARNVYARPARCPTVGRLHANRTLEAVSSILISSTKTAKKPLISGAFLLSR
jgi:hypothetical protein